MIDYAGILRERLRQSLLAARKAQDKASAAGLRSLMAALDNAGAVPADLSGPNLPSAGPADVARRMLGIDDVTALLGRELDKCLSAAAEFKSLGREREAADFESQGAVIERILEEWKREVP